MMRKIEIIGYVWKSQQNGAVYGVGGGIALSQLWTARRSRTEDFGGSL